MNMWKPPLQLVPTDSYSRSVLSEILPGAFTRSWREGFLSPPGLAPEQNWEFGLTRNTQQHSAAGTGFGNSARRNDGRGLSSGEYSTTLWRVQSNPRSATRRASLRD